eukprot:1113469-Pyramimonas_sp.AAC.2
MSARLDTRPRVLLRIERFFIAQETYLVPIGEGVEASLLDTLRVLECGVGENTAVQRSLKCGRLHNSGTWFVVAGLSVWVMQQRFRASAASAPLCNMVLDFAAVKENILKSGGLKQLASMTQVR